MTSDSTTKGASGMRRRANSDGRSRRRRNAIRVLAVAATILPGFTAAAQPAVADASEYRIYMHGFMSDGVVGYNASDAGPPTPIGRTPTGPPPNWPEAASPDGRFLFVAPTQNPRLIPYAIGSGGSLTPRTPLGLPDVPVDITFAPNGRDAFVLVGVTNAAVVPVRFDSDGIVVQNGPVTPLGLAIDGLGSASVSPDGRNLYVASVPSRQVVVFDIREDGTLSGAKQRVAGGMNPLFPTITPDGRHLYIVNELSATVQAFNRAEDGTLSEVAGSPYPAGLLPHVPSMTPDGRYLYVPNMGSAAISSYAIEADGSLRALPTADFDPRVGVYSESSVMSPSGKVLWALGTDPMGAQEVLRRFTIGDDGTLTRDEATVLYPGTAVADGRTLTLVPA